MSAIMVPRLLTAEEFGAADDDTLCELVRGIRVPLPRPTQRHGQVCGNVSFALAGYCEGQRVGRAVAFSGIVTARGPDTVRGADVSFYSFERIPAGPLPRGYLPVLPELVVEVYAWPDKWSRTLAATADYLMAGVGTVVVLDEQTERAWRFGDDEQRVFDRDADLELPPPLAGWRVPVRRFFE